MNWNEYFLYHEEGSLIRVYEPGNNKVQHVGWTNSCGYKQTEVLGKTYMVHRIIYELVSGEQLQEGEQVDHINRNRLDNRFENLRKCTNTQNQINSSVPKNNTTGYKGVLTTPSGKFQARLGYNGKKLYLGLFRTAEEANECVLQKTRELYGEFAAN